MNIYLELTQAFNTDAMRAILSSGQAVVLHRLAVMSKDGDWILRESPEALEAALDAERRALIHANERLLQRYMTAAESWAARWPAVEVEIADLPLRQAHAVVVARAKGLLPYELPEDSP